MDQRQWIKGNGTIIFTVERCETTGAYLFLRHIEVVFTLGSTPGLVGYPSPLLHAEFRRVKYKIHVYGCGLGELAG